jgi:hypothetical protein
MRIGRPILVGFDTTDRFIRPLSRTETLTTICPRHHADSLANPELRRERDNRPAPISSLRLAWAGEPRSLPLAWLHDRLGDPRLVAIRTGAGMAGSRRRALIHVAAIGVSAEESP